MWILPSQLGKLCADVHKNYTFTLKSVNDRMIPCKAGVLCTQCLFWNRSKTPRKNVWNTFNRGENMHKNVRLPIAYHVIGHPVVDAKWTQSIQTPNPVALTEFPGRIWPLFVVFKAADRGMAQEVMICRVKMFSYWWSFKPTVSPVITMAIHAFVQWAFGFSYVLFVATALNIYMLRCSLEASDKVRRQR